MEMIVPTLFEQHYTNIMRPNYFVQGKYKKCVPLTEHSIRYSMNKDQNKVGSPIGLAKLQEKAKDCEVSADLLQAILHMKGKGGKGSKCGKGLKSDTLTSDGFRHSYSVTMGATRIAYFLCGACGAIFFSLEEVKQCMELHTLNHELY